MRHVFNIRSTETFLFKTGPSFTIFKTKRKFISLCFTRLSEGTRNERKEQNICGDDPVSQKCEIVYPVQDRGPWTVTPCRAERPSIRIYGSTPPPPPPPPPELRKLLLNSLFRAVTADSKLRWPGGGKGVLPRCPGDPSGRSTRFANSRTVSRATSSPQHISRPRDRLRRLLGSQSQWPRELSPSTWCY